MQSGAPVGERRAHAAGQRGGNDLVLVVVAKYRGFEAEAGEEQAAQSRLIVPALLRFEINGSTAVAHDVLGARRREAPVGSGEHAEAIAALVRQTQARNPLPEFGPAGGARPAVGQAIGALVLDRLKAYACAQGQRAKEKTILNERGIGGVGPSVVLHQDARSSGGRGAVLLNPLLNLVMGPHPGLDLAAQPQ